jgi:hypothetical protein
MPDQHEQAHQHAEMKHRAIQSAPECRPARQAKESRALIELVILARVDDVEARCPQVTAAVIHKIRGSKRLESQSTPPPAQFPSANPSTT